MQARKKVEVIADRVDLEQVLSVLHAAGVDGHSIIRDIEGSGARGPRTSDEIVALGNVYVMTACTAEQAERIVEALRPVLALRGGICLVSDVLWVRP